MSFELGREAVGRYTSEYEYFKAVKAAIVEKMVEFPALERPVKVIVTGESVDRGFLKVLEEALVELMGDAPPIFAADEIVVAAKGAAEFRRRGKAPWSP